MTNLKPLTTLPTRTLGTSGIKVSVLGLGCMSLAYGLGPAVGKERAKEVIAKAIDLGVNFLDTAEVYGPFLDEEYVGYALSSSSLRQKVVLATKFGVHYRNVNGENKQVIDARSSEIRKSIEGSLKRLKTDYIDLYYQHRVDPNIPIEEVAGVIKDLQKEGKVLAWGLSEAGEQTIKKAHKELALSALQSEYSLWWREPEKSIFPTLKELNIALVPFSPLGKGYLAGALDENTIFQKGDLRPVFPRYQKDALKQNKALLNFLDEIAQTKQVNGKKATKAQIALAWILAQEDFIIPIPGTTKIAHLEENLGALQISFSENEMQEINKKLSAIQIVGDRYPAGSDMAKRVGK
ncbi:aldo/keto reductase [Helicobacter sp. MIT 11-5569]|nr:aldo/keto reductase [Helicobacter sp. MIT 11-5569]